METIFEHGVTEWELKTLFSAAIDREEYILKRNSEGKIADIYRLYKFRGDNNKAGHYLKQMKKPMFNLFLTVPKYLRTHFSR